MFLLNFFWSVCLILPVNLRYVVFVVGDNIMIIKNAKLNCMSSFDFAYDW